MPHRRWSLELVSSWLPFLCACASLRVPCSKMFDRRNKDGASNEIERRTSTLQTQSWGIDSDSAPESTCAHDHAACSKPCQGSNRVCFVVRCTPTLQRCAGGCCRATHVVVSTSTRCTHGCPNRSCAMCTGTLHLGVASSAIEIKLHNTMTIFFAPF